jgi:hypothetical protein
MWKRLGLGAALLLVLGGGLILIDKPVTGEPLAAASSNTHNRATRNKGDRTTERRRRRHRTHRRTRRGSKNMQ